MQPCEVEATFSQQGDPHPRSLIWEDQKLLITDIGRNWKSADGHHILIRVSDGRVFEVVYNGSQWRGQLHSSPPQFT